MSGTNTSKGTPDDDEGRLDRASEADASTSASASRGRSGRGSSTSKPSQSPRKKQAKTTVGARGPRDERRGPIAALVLFVRQVISELRKVVTPTTKELATYSAVVIVFVLVVMAYVGVLDLGIGRLVLWAFGG